MPDVAKGWSGTLAGVRASERRIARSRLHASVRAIAALCAVQRDAESRSRDALLMAKSNCAWRNRKLGGKSIESEPVSDSTSSA